MCLNSFATQASTVQQSWCTRPAPATSTHNLSKTPTKRQAPTCSDTSSVMMISLLIAEEVL